MHFTCEGKQMHHYILQLSFYYTIKGHIEIFYNLEVNSINKNYFSCIQMATIEK